MPWSFFIPSFFLGMITGFSVFSRGRKFFTTVGFIAKSLLSTICFILIFIAFWKFGLLMGLLEVCIIFLGGNVGLLILHLCLKYIK